MTRKRTQKKRKGGGGGGGGGFLSGMRRGVQSAVGASDREPSKRNKLFWNAVTVVLAIVAGYFILRRFGVLGSP